MENSKYKGELDYEKIIIYPYEYSPETRRRLHKLLRKIGIRIECEQY